MVIKRSLGGESTGGDRSASSMCKCCTGVNSDIGNGSFGVKIRDARHADRYRWRTTHQLTSDLNIIMLIFSKCLQMVVSESSFRACVFLGKPARLHSHFVPFVSAHEHVTFRLVVNFVIRKRMFENCFGCWKLKNEWRLVCKSTFLAKREIRNLASLLWYQNASRRPWKSENGSKQKLKNLPPHNAAVWEGGYLHSGRPLILTHVPPFEQESPQTMPKSTKNIHQPMGIYIYCLLQQEVYCILHTEGMQNCCFKTNVSPTIMILFA